MTRFEDRTARPTPPPNRYLCDQCWRENCPGHPVFATMVMIAIMLIPATIVAVLITKHSR